MSKTVNPPAGLAESTSDTSKIIRPAIQVGFLSGMCGLFVGGVSGVLRTTTPLLFALGAGVQWFTLGTTFWGVREVILQRSGAERKTQGAMVSASALAGGVSGGVGGLLRGPRNVVPGAIIFTLFGSIGQTTSNILRARHERSNNSTGSHNENSWLDSRWSPVTALSDADYEDMLQERLLRINAEIALVDEGIQALRAQAQDLLQERRDATSEENNERM